MVRCFSSKKHPPKHTIRSLDFPLLLPCNCYIPHPLHERCAACSLLLSCCCHCHHFVVSTAVVAVVVFKLLSVTSIAATTTHTGFHSIPAVICCPLTIVHHRHHQTLSSPSTAPAIAVLHCHSQKLMLSIATRCRRHWTTYSPLSSCHCHQTPSNTVAVIKHPCSLPPLFIANIKQHRLLHHHCRCSSAIKHWWTLTAIKCWYPPLLPDATAVERQICHCRWTTPLPTIFTLQCPLPQMQIMLFIDCHWPPSAPPPPTAFHCHLQPLLIVEYFCCRLWHLYSYLHPPISINIYRQSQKWCQVDDVLSWLIFISVFI